MFNKTTVIKFSELSTLKAVFPEATLHDMIKLKNRGTVKDIAECKATFPESSISDIEAIVGSRSFIRWYVNNRKVVNILALATPLIALPLLGLAPGSFALDLLTHGSSTVAYATEPASIVAFGTPAGSAVSAIPNAVTTLAPVVSTSAVGITVATASTGFFSGKGAILLHMLVIGFFTLVVSSFLKFTGRGDLIPLVAFVGGGIILYEVIQLFNDIYGAIRTLINM